jgi:Fe-S-cluster containining protein
MSNSNNNSSFFLSGQLVSYPNNIIWKCQKCAICCQDTTVHLRRIRILTNEAINISKKKGIPINEFASLTPDKIYSYEINKNNSTCYFLLKKRCKIYSYRPLVCRFYPFELKNECGSLKFQVIDHECLGIERGHKLQEHFYKRLTIAALELWP